MTAGSRVTLSGSPEAINWPLSTLLGFQALNEGRHDAPSTIGYVPQSIARDIGYPVLQMVAMGRVARRGLFAAPTRSDNHAARAALATVGIEVFAERPFNRLSGGERQLVLLARALATETSILLLDEPASALDLRNQERFLGVVDTLRFAGDHAILFTTHLPQHAAAVADDALLLFGPEERLFGPMHHVMTEANLSRLYGLPLRIVDVATASGETRGVVPLFRRTEEPETKRGGAQAGASFH